MSLEHQVPWIHATTMNARPWNALSASTGLIVAFVVNDQPIRDRGVPLLIANAMSHEAAFPHANPAVAVVVARTPEDQTFTASVESVVEKFLVRGDTPEGVAAERVSVLQESLVVSDAHPP